MAMDVTASGQQCLLEVTTNYSLLTWFSFFTVTECLHAAELQWLEHFWSHEKISERGVVRANEC